MLGCTAWQPGHPQFPTRLAWACLLASAPAVGPKVFPEEREPQSASDQCSFLVLALAPRNFCLPSSI